MSKTGVVKFFHDEKGYGFIVQDDGSPDLFAHRNDCVGNNIQEGDRVEYDEVQNDRNGKAQAKNVVGGTGPPAGMGGGGGKKGGKGGKKGGGGGGFGGGMGGCMGGFGGGPMMGGMGGAPMMGGMGGPKTGVVKYFNEEKGFGFILQDDGSPDIFAHRNNVMGNSLQEGDRVTYDLGEDDRNGKPCANNISGGTGGPLAPSKGGRGKGKGGKGGKGGGFGGAPGGGYGGPPAPGGGLGGFGGPGGMGGGMPGGFGGDPYAGRDPYAGPGGIGGG